MNILEQIYDTELSKISFQERKVSLNNENTILLGPPKSGKSYIIYDYLSLYHKENYLYIDLNDYKNDQNEIIKYLEYFIRNNNITILVLENYKFDFNLPKVITTIITTNKTNKIDDFKIVTLQPLDFEEFLLFDTKHQNMVYSFNSFLKYGNMPEIIEYNELKKSTRNYEICKLYCDDTMQLNILMLLIKNGSEKKSILQLFTVLKKQTKISKDKFYKIIAELQYNKIIFFIPKYNQPKAVKKLFIFNHALLDIVSYNKNFNNLFKNMIFLELNTRYDQLFYLDNVDFYLPSINTIVLAIPFFNNLISSKIISKLILQINKYNIKTITIVTVSGEQTLFIENIEATIVPFYSWVLSI